MISLRKQRCSPKGLHPVIKGSVYEWLRIDPARINPCDSFSIWNVSSSARTFQPRLSGGEATREMWLLASGQSPQADRANLARLKQLELRESR